MMTNQQIAVSLILGVIASFFISRDLLSRGRSSREAWVWGVAAVVDPIVVTIMYFFLRGREQAVGAAPANGTCRYCGALIEDDPIYCPACSKQLRGAESVHGKK